MIKIKYAELAKSAVQKSQYPSEPLAQIVLLGRSNVGKSSLINCLINRKHLARTSSAPGKTRLLNFYRVEGLAGENTPLAWFFVDLPGYGYAKVSKTEREQFLQMIDRFLQEDMERKYCWQLVDIRHEPTQDDIDMVNFLRATGAKFQLIATKADKISRGARMKYTAPIGRALQTQPWELICWSSENGNGRDQLLKVIEQAIKA